MSVACGSSPIKIDYSDYQQKISLSVRFVAITLVTVNMVSVTSASRDITSASRYHPRYQSRPSMYIRGLIPRNISKLAEAVPIGQANVLHI